MKIYIIIYVDNYIPSAVARVDREQALKEARDYSSGWENNSDSREMDLGADEIFFAQEEEGNMELAVSVVEADLSHDTFHGSG